MVLSRGVDLSKACDIESTCGVVTSAGVWYPFLRGVGATFDYRLISGLMLIIPLLFGWHVFQNGWCWKHAQLMSVCWRSPGVTQHCFKESAVSATPSSHDSNPMRLPTGKWCAVLASEVYTNGACSAPPVAGLALAQHRCWWILMALFQHPLE